VLLVRYAETWGKLVTSAMSSIFQKWGVGMHNDFTLFSRKVTSGKTEVYYYTITMMGRGWGLCEGPGRFAEKKS
jgi:hypothetical protein